MRCGAGGFFLTIFRLWWLLCKGRRGGRHHERYFNWSFSQFFWTYCTDQTQNYWVWSGVGVMKSSRQQWFHPSARELFISLRSLEESLLNSCSSFDKEIIDKRYPLSLFIHYKREDAKNKLMNTVSHKENRQTYRHILTFLRTICDFANASPDVTEGQRPVLPHETDMQYLCQFRGEGSVITTMSTTWTTNNTRNCDGFSGKSQLYFSRLPKLDELCHGDFNTYCKQTIGSSRKRS